MISNAKVVITHQVDVIKMYFTKVKQMITIIFTEPHFVERLDFCQVLCHVISSLKRQSSITLKCSEEELLLISEIKFTLKHLIKGS